MHSLAGVLLLLPMQALSLRMSMTSVSSTRSLTRPIIIGAGPTGLATAIMLARRGYSNIRVFDKFPEPALPDDASVWESDQVLERTYNIGLSARGQIALDAIGALPTVLKYTQELVGNKIWTPETVGEPEDVMYKGRTHNTRTLQRDRLTGALLELIRSELSDRISVQFNTLCMGAEWVAEGSLNELCRVILKDTSNEIPLFSTEDSTFVLGADGTQSAVRDAVARTSWLHRFSVKKFSDDNPNVYRTIAMHLPTGRRKDLNYR